MKISETPELAKNVGMKPAPTPNLNALEWKRMNNDKRKEYLYAVRRTLFDVNSILCTENEVWREYHKNDSNESDDFRERLGSLERYGRRDGMECDRHDACVIEEVLRYVTGIPIEVAYWGWKGNTKLVRLKFPNGFTAPVFVGDEETYFLGMLISSTNEFLMYLVGITYYLVERYNALTSGKENFVMFLYDDCAQFPLYQFYGKMPRPNGFLDSDISYDISEVNDIYETARKMYGSGNEGRFMAMFGNYDEFMQYVIPDTIVEEDAV